MALLYSFSSPLSANHVVCHAYRRVEHRTCQGGFLYSGCSPAVPGQEIIHGERFQVSLLATVVHLVVFLSLSSSDLSLCLPVSLPPLSLFLRPPPVSRLCRYSVSLVWLAIFVAHASRGLQENTVSPNFATLSESLYIAERKAREETRLRGEMLKQVAMREKDQKEADLRDLASRARLERAGIAR